MKPLNRALVLGVIAMSLLVGRAYADDNKGTNTTGQKAQPADMPSSVQTIQVAGDLAAWSRANKDAVGLATAAKLLASDPPRHMDNPNKKPGDSKPTDQPKPSASDFTPDSLIAEAKTMAGSDPDTLAAVQQIEKTLPQSRGHPGGAILDQDILPPGGSMTYTIAFNGQEPMEIAVFAGSPGLIDWHIYDENGNEIISESSDHFVNVPKWTGPFRIVLTNLSGAYVPYSFATN
jgi:hypothetical protein